MQPDFTSNKNPQKDLNLYIIIGVTLIAIMDGQAIAPILPNLTKVFDVSPGDIELVMTIFFLPFGIATPILSLLADRIGIKKVLIPSLLLFGIAGGCSSFAHDFQTLLEWRFVQGIGGASLDALAMTMIAMCYRGKALTVAMSINASVIGMSTAIYPLIGGALGGFSWRYPFLLSVFAFPIVMSILMVLKLPQKPTSEPQPNLKVYLGNIWSSINNRSVFALLLAVCALFAIQFGAFLTYLPILAGINLGASGLFNGLMLGSMSISLALVASQLRWLIGRVSEITLIKIAFLIMAIAMGIVPTIHNPWLLLVPSILFGVAQALALPSSQALLAGLAADNARGGFMAVNATVQSLGQALGPLMAGIFFSLGKMFGVFWATAIFALIILGLFHVLLIPKRETPTPQPQPQTEFFETPSIVTSSVLTSVNLPIYQFASQFPTVVQLQTAKLIHLPSERIINLPNSEVLINLGKRDRSQLSDLDLSDFPHAGVVSRNHAQIRVEKDEYYIQDRGSSNGTYLNRYPLLPGNWYHLKSGDRISLGKGSLVAFQFEISASEPKG